MDDDSDDVNESASEGPRARGLGLVTRLFHAFTGVVERYAEEAKDEALRDLRRLAIAVFCLAMMMVFVLHTVAFAHATAIAVAVAYGAPTHFVIGGVLAFDVFMVFTCFVVGVFSISRPILPRTRKNIREIQKVYRLLAGP